MVDKGRNQAKQQQNKKPVTNDDRFKHVHSDPRFRRLKKEDRKVKIDKRFESMLTSKDFGADKSGPKVDKYGRPLEGETNEDLKRFYDLEESGPEEDDNEQSLSDLERELAADQENQRDEISENEEDSEEESEEDDDDEEGGDSVSRILKKKRAQGLDVMRGEGALSESDTDDETEEEDEAESSEDEQDKIPTGDATRRFAAVNMDWDRLQAVDLLKVLGGFKPAGGVIERVSIYPSEFGKERMAREDLEGPPKEIFQAKGEKSDDEKDEDEKDDEEDEEDEGEFDQEALRKYQLERLKYYYAVIECDSVETAQAIYNACDGNEYESSANFFDLRYIPDDMEFTDEPRETATVAPDDYKVPEFNTEALQHTKVKLTWDADARDRIHVTRRKFTEEDLENLDFDTYLASDSDESGDDDVEAMREKYRKLLNSEDNTFEGREFEEEGDMEITFAPGLSEAVDEAVDQKLNGTKEETSIEKYMRKQREKRQAKKDRKKAAQGPDGMRKDEEEDEDEVDSAAEMEDDPYFKETLQEMEEEGMQSIKKDKKKDKKKKLTKEEREERDRERAELELLMGDAVEGEGFNMKEVIKQEKAAKKKGRKSKKIAEQARLAAKDDFELDTSDPRFSALHESHHFAIDPNNPQFKRTKNMEKLLNERTKRARHS
ncbi:hypothetical protein BCR43DRAFT_557795 [Syncephalastrum racemosum]|uniref:Uncharacterized protein n=1 Tax=Syncephalastrum racemosum TaxID=13706 RepID=A0A1X2H738_SYNRA|nr:hypothetical protein BCR43DRAFT_557795 [Syncephalastrum racemosum]